MGESHSKKDSKPVSDQTLNQHKPKIEYVSSVPQYNIFHRKIAKLGLSDRIHNDITFIKDSNLILYSGSNTLSEYKSINIFDKSRSRPLKRLSPHIQNNLHINFTPSFKIINSSFIIIANDLSNIKICSLYSGLTQQNIRLNNQLQQNVDPIPRIRRQILIIEEIAPMIVAFNWSAAGTVTIWDLNEETNDIQPKIIIQKISYCSRILSLSKGLFAILTDNQLDIHECTSFTCLYSYKQDITANYFGLFPSIDTRGNQRVILGKQYSIEQWRFKQGKCDAILRSSNLSNLRMVVQNEKIFVLQSNISREIKNLIVIDEKSTKYMYESYIEIDYDHSTEMNMHVDFDDLIYFSGDYSYNIFQLMKC